MKPKSALRRFLLVAGSLLLAVSSSHAADGTWNSDVTNSLWGTDTNWLGNTIADGSGSTANFTNDITGDRTVRLNGDRTLTSVVFGDSDTATAGSWLLDNDGTSTNNLITAADLDLAGLESGERNLLHVLQRRGQPGPRHRADHQQAT